MLMPHTKAPNKAKENRSRVVFCLAKQMVKTINNEEKKLFMANTSLPTEYVHTNGEKAYIKPAQIEAI